jgi:hypothetical protein
MNAKQLIAALSIAAAASGAFAIEGEQFVPPASTLTPAGIAAIQAAKTQAPSAVVVANKEATQFADVAVAKRPREEVRAEARIAARTHAFNPLYVGN